MTPTIQITLISILAIAGWETFRMFYRKFFVEEPIKHYQPERHEYPKKEEPTIPISRGRDIPNPNYKSGCSEMGCDCDNGIEVISKKDCECDCVGECKKEPDPFETANAIHGLNTDFIFTDVNFKVGYAEILIDGKNAIEYNFQHYMRRGNKQYFRGDNIKVVVTVKGGE